MWTQVPGFRRSPVMRIRMLYVVRPYSGLEGSLRSGVWSPTGVPAVYKMLECLSGKNHEVMAVFTCKDYERYPIGRRDWSFTLKGLEGIRIRVLAGKEAMPRSLGPVRGAVRELRQTSEILRICRDFDPDLLYFDRANFMPAAFFARWGKWPVVLRLMGVGTPFLKEVIRGGRPRVMASRWAFKSPFAAVICTQDGSGVERWLDKALGSSVRRSVLLNGADITAHVGEEEPAWMSVPEGRTVVLFVGRLEEIKGCREFLEGFLIALREEGAGIHALIVGSGTLFDPLRETCERAGVSSNVTFTGELPHKQIALAYRRSHIYVSLNRGGNLSNANLEAMKAGLCMILPSSCPETGVDTATDRILPMEAGYRIPHAGDTTSLAKAILHLHRDPAERKARARMTAAVGVQSIPTWRERVESEMALLERVVAESLGRQKSEGRR